MSLTLGFNNSRDLLSKLQRDANSLLNESVTADKLMNFVLTGYSLIDWIVNDPSVPLPAKNSSKIQALRVDKNLAVCGDIANSIKHFNLNRRIPITKSTNNLSGFGVGQFGMGAFGEGEEEILITLNDGTSMNALELVRDILKLWQTFFKDHNI